MGGTRPRQWYGTGIFVGPAVILAGLCSLVAATACLPPGGPAGWLPGAGWGAVASDGGGAVGAGDLAGAVGVDGQGPAEFVQHHVVVPPAVPFEVVQAGVAAVCAVDHVVGFAPGRGLVAAAGVLACLVPQGDQAPQVGRDLV